jgi:hypothetical protein
MSEDFYTKQGRYRVVEIKYYDRIDRQIITENFGYSSLEEFCRKVHKFYELFVEKNPLWISLEFHNTRGHKKYYHFDTIFEFYCFYSGILNAGELVK